MSKNYNYYYTTHKLPSRESARGNEYESEYNEECESDEYYEGNYDSEYYNRQINYTDCIPEDVPTSNVQPTSEPRKTIPKTASKLPYCIVPVLYVPKRIVQKEEIARNKVLQSSLASLSRMENLFYKYKSNYENDASKQTAPDIDVPLPQKSNMQDFLAPNAYSNNCYYDSHDYEYCTANTNYDDDYVTNYRKPQFHEPFQDNYKAINVIPNNQTSVPSYNYLYNYEREIDPTFANRRSNPYMDAAYYDRQSNDIHQYTRDDWLACQGRRSQSINPMNYNMAGVCGKLSKNFKSNYSNTRPKSASLHSIGINAIAEHDSKISQTSGCTPGFEERRSSIYCEMATQTEQQNYGSGITHQRRSPSRHRGAKSDFSEVSDDVHSHSARSATMIPKLKTTLPSCNAAESTKSCIHERSSCDMRHKTICPKSLRAMSPEAVRKFWK